MLTGQISSHALQLVHAQISSGDTRSNTLLAPIEISGSMPTAGETTGAFEIPQHPQQRDGIGAARDGHRHAVARADQRIGAQRGENALNQERHETGQWGNAHCEMVPVQGLEPRTLRI